ncbi:hypothetical protein NSTCB13_06193 [Nostoc sp. DSM 114160]
MTIIFQFALIGLVLLSFVLVVGVPVAYATPQNWNESKKLLWVGSGGLDWFGVFSWLVKLFCRLGDGFALAQAHNIRTRGAEKPRSKVKGNKRFFSY